jgi:hypothetical protein
MKADERTKSAPKVAGARAVSLAALAVVAVLLLVGLQGLPGARAYTPWGNLEPNPFLEGNVTVSNHTYTGGILSFPNGTGQQNLPGFVDPRVVNPVVVNPAGIVAVGLLQNSKVGGVNWNATASWSTFPHSAGQTSTGPTAVTVNGEPAIQWTVNTTHAATESGLADLSSAINLAQWPSSNPSFDYWTAIFTVVCSAACTGTHAEFIVGNASGNCQSYEPSYAPATGLPTPNGVGTSVRATVTTTPQTYYVSESQATMSNTAHCGLNATGPGSTASVNPGFWMDTDLQASSATVTLTLQALSFSNSQISLGKTYWAASSKANVTQGAFAGNINLSALSPTFTYNYLTGGALTIAVCQSANTVGATSISQLGNANGSETLTYVFQYHFPVAASLSYGAFKLVDIPRLAAWQYLSVSFGGAAYTSVYQVTSNVGNYTTVVASVSPTASNSWVGTVTYTGVQWDAISQAPGFFSTNGLEYWWFVLIGAILAAAGTSSLWVVNSKRGLQQRRGVARLPFSGGHRRIRNRQGAGRHYAAIATGLVILGAGAIGVYSVFTGADAIGASGAFVAGLILLTAIVLVAFLVYEIAMYARRHEHR